MSIIKWNLAENWICECGTIQKGSYSVFYRWNRPPHLVFRFLSVHKKGSLHIYKEMEGEIDAMVRNENEDPVFNNLVIGLMAEFRERLSILCGDM